MSHLLDIRCPSCQSRQLSTAEKSGGRLTLTCLACGYVFKATDTDTTPQKIIETPVKPAEPPVSTTPATSTPDRATLNRRIIEIAQTSGKVNAVKYCKDNTGWSLSQCKEYVDEVVDKGQADQWNTSGSSVASGPEETRTMAQQIIEIARTRGKLHAVKYYKDQTGKGLKESLECVDKVVPPGVYKKTEGCFIATACYGNYDAKEVLVLRRYRDDVLQQTTVGRLMVRLYYAVSPALARLIQNKTPLQKAIRHYILQPIVNKLSQTV